MNMAWLLFSFKGRIGRQPFWIFTLLSIVMILGPAIYLFGLGSEEAEDFVNMATLVIIWPSLAVQAKRWHDRDKTAWWILINFVPLIGVIWALVENGFLRGTESANRFGEAPNQA